MGQVIAVVGKGGVGKTTLCAALVRGLGEMHPQASILAIDADPAVGLSTALGVEPGVTLDELRSKIIEKAEGGKGQEALELLGEARYEIFDALTETEAFSFLAIGRPEGAGCYCAINSYLKKVIEMVAGSFDYILIDGEAGVEQINRRVMEKVNALLVVSDESKKGIQVAHTICEMAPSLVGYDWMGVVLNRLHGTKREELWDQPEQVAALIEDDAIYARNDMLGRTIFELDRDCCVYREALGILEKLS